VEVLGPGIDECSTDTSNNTCRDHNICTEDRKCERIEGPGIDLCDTDLDCPAEEDIHFECDIEKSCVELPGPGPQECTDCTLTHTECDRNNRCVVVDAVGDDTCSNDLSCTASHTECNSFDQCVAINETGIDQCYLDSECTHTVCGSSQGVCGCIEQSGPGVNECTDGLSCSLLSSDCQVATSCQDNQCTPQACLDGDLCEDLCLSEASCCPEESYTACEDGKCICKPGVGQPDQCLTDANCSYHTECIFQQCIGGILNTEGNTVDQCDLLNGNIDCGIPPYATDLVVDSGSYCTGLPFGVVGFSWTYKDVENDPEKMFILQVDDNSDFSSPEYNETWDNLIYPYDSENGTHNEHSIPVQMSDTVEGGGFIKYGVEYYWRVKVSKYNGDLSSDWIYYDGLAGTTEANSKIAFTYGYSHPAPIVAYDIWPEAPIIDEQVYFDDSRSFCYIDGETESFACSGLSSGYTWTFYENGPLTPNRAGGAFYTYTNQGTYATTLEICDSYKDQNGATQVGCCFAEKDVSIKNESSTELPKYREIAPN
jgi:hypothetical protein